MKGNNMLKNIPVYVSLFVAACALSVSIWEGKEKGKRNRLSVIPHLDVTIVSKEPESEKGGIRIINDGIGPAVINTIKLSRKNRVIINDNESNYTHTKWLTLHEIFWPGNKDIEVSYLYPKPGGYLQTDKRIFALEVPSEQLKDPDVWCKLSDVKLEISYSDVYGNEFQSEFDAPTHLYFSECSKRKTGSDKY